MNQKTKDRNRTIIRYSLAGAGLNLVLAVFKMIVGSAAHAHAIVMDGVNSLSDMTASVISVISSLIAGKRGNRNHPFGYGRLEYIGSMVVTLIIIYIGVMSIIDAVESIINPHDAPEYSGLTIAVMTVSLVAKLAYGIVMRKQGKRLHSDALVISAADSMGDALISVGILAAIILYRLTGVDIEHYVCIAISLMILKTGIGLIHECGTKVLGTRVDPVIRQKLVDTVMREEEVLNISNILLHNYGEGNYVGSVDIEVDGRMTAARISRLTRRIIRKGEEIGVLLTSVGISGTDVDDPEATRIWDSVIDTARQYKSIKRVCSPVIDTESRTISFYVIQDYGFSRRERDHDLHFFSERIRAALPEMEAEIRQGIDA